MVLTKRLNFLIQVRNEYSPQPSKLLYNCQFKNKEALSNSKKLSEDGGRADFLKNLLDTTFNKDLSNEPNFGRIQIAGQYL